MERPSLRQHFQDKKPYIVRLIYDQWEGPESTEREQIKVGPCPVEDLLAEYGDFKFDGAYTTGFHPESGVPIVDVWATAVGEKRYRNPHEVVEKTNEDYPDFE